jgi:hypothetical protein
MIPPERNLPWNGSGCSTARNAAEDGQYAKEETERLRKEEAYPVLRAFEKRLDANYSRVLPKSPIGNHEAAKRTAIIYSLLGTCKIDNLNPTEWITVVLNRINDCKTNELRRLLTGQWMKSDGV